MHGQLRLTIRIQQQLRTPAINHTDRTRYCLSSFHVKRCTKSHRSFSTSQRTQSPRDHSSIDVAYMPRFEPSVSQQSEVRRVPILPTNSTASSQVDEDPIPVTRPEIATVSANGTYIDSPSAMSEVTDNHAIEISPFDLTGQVTNAAAAAASKMAEVQAEIVKDQGIVQEFFSGLLDDVLGEKKVVKA